MGDRPTRVERPFVTNLWGQLNNLSNSVQDALPNQFQDFLGDALSRLPFSMERHPDSGDFTERPAFFDPRTVTNFVKRYFGNPLSRASAWEDLALYLDRWGWRMSDYAFNEAYKLHEMSGSLPEQKTKPTLIYETKNFWTYVSSGLLIDRADGGHLVIAPKVDTLDRMSFTPELAAEYIMLSMATGRAMQQVINEAGIPVERLNFMDMGNWRLLTPKTPRFHEHIFGRARGSRFQIHGEFNKIPPKGSKHYKCITPLSADDIYRLNKLISTYFREYFESAEKENVFTGGFVTDQLDSAHKSKTESASFRDMLLQSKKAEAKHAAQESLADLSRDTSKLTRVSVKDAVINRARLLRRSAVSGIERTRRTIRSFLTVERRR